METRAADAPLSVRIGDVEREKCLELLSEHHVQGRLTADELDRRQHAALTAVTEDDLAGLFADLPVDSSPPRSLTVANDWWSLEPSTRSLRVARWIVPPIAL